MGVLAAYPLLENTLAEFRNTTVNTNANMHFGGNVSIDGTLTTTGTGMEGAQVITATSANALAVGQAGITNPVFNVDSSTASSATGLNIKSAAAGSRVALSVLSSGTNESISIDPLGTGTILLSALGAGSTGVQIGGTASLTSAILTVKSQNAQALAVGIGGKTNAALNVDTSTAASATGLNIKAFAAGNGLNLSVITSGTNEQLKIDAAGSGMVTIGSTSTGQVSIGRGNLGSVIESSTIAALGTTQNSTPSAAQLLGGIVTQTGATGAGTVTLPTGTQISGGVAGVAVGDTFDCVYSNLGGGFNEVITGATGSTVVGNATVPTGKNAYLTFVNTGANTWNVYVIVSA